VKILVCGADNIDIPPTARIFKVLR